MTNRERLEVRKQELTAAWDLAEEKSSKLRKAKILETRADEKMLLDSKIKENEQERAQIEAQLAQVERDLEQATPPDAEPCAENRAQTPQVSQTAGDQSIQINQARDVTITR